MSPITRRLRSLLSPGLLVAITLLAVTPASSVAQQVAPTRHYTAPDASVGGAIVGPAPLWLLSAAGASVITAPAVGRDGTLYLATSDGVLRAITSDGQPRWSLRAGVTSGQSPLASPAIGGDGTSYWNLRGSLVAIDPRGRVRWVFLAAGNGSPVLSRGRVLFAAGIYLYAIETTGVRAGQAAWRAAIGSTGAGSSGPTPALGPDGTAYLPSPDGYLYAIAPTGLRRWASHLGAGVLYSPLVEGDGTVYLVRFAAGHGTLYALGADGRLRWRTAVPVGSSLTHSSDGTLYVASHLLVALSPRGRLLWQRVVDAAAAPVVQGSQIVVATLQPAALLAFDRHGAALWRVALPGPIVAAPTTGPGGRFYSADYSGTVVVLAPGRGRPLRHIVMSAPAGSVVTLGATNPPFIVRAGSTVWRATLDRMVQRSDDSGVHWRVVLTPGQSTAVPGSAIYRNARYADLSFLAVNPLMPRALYVGTVGALGDYLAGGSGGADGGLYYSANGVGTWQHLTKGLPYTYEPRLRVPTYGLDSLVFDPQHRGVLYLQSPATFGSPDHDAGLYKSSDGGARWQQATSGLTPQLQSNALTGSYQAYPSGTLLLDRTHPQVLFLVAPTGFFRSGDAAAHWLRVRGVSYTDPASVTVRIGTGGRVRVYADRGVYLSDDDGLHWRLQRS